LRGTGKSTWARQCFPDALTIDLRSGPVARTLTATPERLHEVIAGLEPSRWVVIDEIGRAPTLLDAVHQAIDRDPRRRFLMTGSSARALHRAGVNLLGGRAGRRQMSPFLAAELGERFRLDIAERIGMLPIIWTAEDADTALHDYATVAILDEARAEARLREVAGFARALEQLALSHGAVVSPTAIAQQAEVKRTTVSDWIDLLEAMFIIARVEVFSARPSRRALAAQPKLFFTDTGLARVLRSTARSGGDTAAGALREGLVYQHLAAWCDARRDARLWTWRTTSGTEIDFVVETDEGLLAIEVKTASTLRPADRRGLLAFRDEFPDARLLAVTGTPLPYRDGAIQVEPLESFLRRVRPGEAL
jgi:predicted AAA+ superfamily ATPase